MLLHLQDGSDTVCLGVDTLNTETLEVTPILTIYTFLNLCSEIYAK